MERADHRRFVAGESRLPSLSRQLGPPDVPTRMSGLKSALQSAISSLSTRPGTRVDQSSSGSSLYGLTSTTTSPPAATSFDQPPPVSRNISMLMCRAKESGLWRVPSGSEKVRRDRKSVGE